MTNTALQAMIAEFGDRIQIVIFDNNTKIYIGYASSPLKSTSDIQFKTYSGFDMIGVPFDVVNPESKRLGMSAVVWHATDAIQAVIVMDEEPNSKGYLIQPAELG